MSQQSMKIEAARAALEYVESGMRLGIGTGSTAEEFVKLLAERVNDGLEIIGVPTSERTAKLCTELGVPLSSLDETPQLDLTIDGADELDANLSLIKGGGGALLREKIVAFASKKMIVIADGSKVVEKLGAFPLPIEVNIFGLAATKQAVEDAASRLNLVGTIKIRETRDGDEFKTDGGHLILDASFGHICDPEALSNALHAIPGVVEHGLFIGLADVAVVAQENGIEIKTTAL
ncbi:ribose-5-phosphate isomerase RpiA [Ahrensia kielensis]|uniref:ribose-5-phosphate isomerase RpiA n=1 Tax=Ahrensia kielensis TaxID=76980 RepID=UPI0005A94131|nr:ribose-5-phosphate isomerase RpiA [Ahrensia kielensis]